MKERNQTLAIMTEDSKEGLRCLLSKEKMAGETATSLLYSAAYDARMAFCG